MPRYPATPAIPIGLEKKTLYYSLSPEKKRKSGGGGGRESTIGERKIEMGRGLSGLGREEIGGWMERHSANPPLFFRGLYRRSVGGAKAAKVGFFPLEIPPPQGLPLFRPLFNLRSRRRKVLDRSRVAVGVFLRFHINDGKSWLHELGKLVLFMYAKVFCCSDLVFEEKRRSGEILHSKSTLPPLPHHILRSWATLAFGKRRRRGRKGMTFTPPLAASEYKGHPDCTERRRKAPR